MNRKPLSGRNSSHGSSFRPPRKCLHQHCRRHSYWVDHVSCRIRSFIQSSPCLKKRATNMARTVDLQMLRDLKDLLGFEVEAADGPLGHVRDCYFDDEAWVIRYLVVETGNWLLSRKVLISPFSVVESTWTSDKLPVRLTREQVRNSPSIDTDKPVSRQHELDFGGYYAYPNYWGGAGLWGAGIFPGAMLTGVGCAGAASAPVGAQSERQRMAHLAANRDDDNPHLRSCKAVVGYHIHAMDGDLGHVQGMLVEANSWAIRYLIMDTSNWWLGHQVLVAPEWITEVSWLDRTVSVGLTRQAIKASPHWDPARLPDRSHEALIHHHYGRRGYWEYEPPAPDALPVDTDFPADHR